MALRSELLASSVDVLRASHAIQHSRIVGPSRYPSSNRSAGAAWSARAELAKRNKAEAAKGKASSPLRRSKKAQRAQASTMDRAADSRASVASDGDAFTIYSDDLFSEADEGPLGPPLDMDDFNWTPPANGDGESQMLAAVDLGTNSFHMVVVKADSKGNFQIQDVEKEDVRLGSGSAGFSVITPEAEERAVAALKRLKQIAHTRGAVMRVVATSAVREARNRSAFVRRLFDAVGVEVEVLSGREEAIMIYQGILQALPVYHRTVLTVDIGGGSTEFVIGRKGQPLLATSLKLGHIRLTERFASGPVLNKGDLEEMRRYIRVLLNDSGVVEAVRSLQGDIEMAIGSSGTIETIEQMCNQAGGLQTGSNGANGVSGPSTNGGSGKGASAEAGSALQGKGVIVSSPQLRHEPNTCPIWGFKEREFSREQLSAVVKKLCKAKSIEARAKIPGLPEKRVDVIVGGAILLEEIFLALGIQTMKVSPYALREGVIVDTIARTYEDFSPSTNLRHTSVMKLAQKFNTLQRLDSALHSAELAKQILAGLQTCKLGGKDCLSLAIRQLDAETDCELMAAATILHYVGMFISHKGYHKHSHYLIKNSEQLLGYTPMEVEVIALLVRYHRKKPPSNKDEDMMKLPEDVRQKIRVLSAIVRVAVALDRCDTGAVERVLVLQDEESCVLAVTPATDPDTGLARDVSLEMWAARAELEYFQKIFKKTASLVLIDDLDADALDAERSRSLSS